VVVPPHLVAPLDVVVELDVVVVVSPDVVVHLHVVVPCGAGLEDVKKRLLGRIIDHTHQIGDRRIIGTHPSMLTGRRMVRICQFSRDQPRSGRAREDMGSGRELLLKLVVI